MNYVLRHYHYVRWLFGLALVAGYFAFGHRVAFAIDWNQSAKIPTIGVVSSTQWINANLPNNSGSESYYRLEIVLPEETVQSDCFARPRAYDAYDTTPSIVSKYWTPNVEAQTETASVWASRWTDATCETSYGSSLQLVNIRWCDVSGGGHDGYPENTCSLNPGADGADDFSFSATSTPINLWTDIILGNATSGVMAWNEMASNTAVMYATLSLPQYQASSTSLQDVGWLSAWQMCNDTGLVGGMKCWLFGVVSDMATRAPWGYLTRLSDALLSGFQTGYDSTSDQDMVLEIGQMFESATSTVNVTEQVRDLVGGQEQLNSIRTISGYIFWILWAILIIELIMSNWPKPVS